MMSICYLWICSDGSVHKVLEVFSDMLPLINCHLIIRYYNDMLLMLIICIPFMIRWVDLSTELATRKTLASCSMVL